MKVQVKDIQPGDQVSDGKIVGNKFVGNHCGQKDRHYVTIERPDGNTTTRVWGRYTTINITR